MIEVINSKMGSSDIKAKYGWATTRKPMQQ
jgi:hypothetical protein